MSPDMIFMPPFREGGAALIVTGYDLVTINLCVMRCNTLATTGDFPVQHTEKANASSGLNKGFQCQMLGVHFETL